MVAGLEGRGLRWWRQTLLPLLDEIGRDPRDVARREAVEESGGQFA